MVGSEIDSVGAITLELFCVTKVKILVCLVIVGAGGVGATMISVTWRGSASSSPGSLGILALQNKLRRFFGTLKPHVRTLLCRASVV